MKTRFSIATKKDIGGRDQQQDQTASFVSGDNKSCLLVIADGMGGHCGGKQAAELVVKAANTMWKTHRHNSSMKPQSFLSHIFTNAHKLMMSLKNRKGLNPKSTCVALYIEGNTAYFSHMGDSRLYHCRNNKVINRTKDHSVVQMLSDIGHIDESEMGRHKDQGRLWKCINAKEEPKPHLSSSDIRAEDYFVLCSDGLWEQLSTQEILDSLRSKNHVKQIATRLIDVAKRRGGDDGDNISVAILYLKKGFWSLRRVVLYVNMMLLVVLLLSSYSYFFQHQKQWLSFLPFSLNQPLSRSHLTPALPLETIESGRK